MSDRPMHDDVAPDPSLPRTVLFIRAVPVAAASPALGWLRKRCPRATVTALTSTSARAALLSTGAVDDTVAYDKKRFSIMAAGPLIYLSLLRRAFDLVVVPHMGQRLPFANVARFALALRGRQTVWIDCSAPPKDSASLSDLTPVTRADLRTTRGRHAALRERLLALLKWPALWVVFVVSLVALAVTAAVLLPFVWLKPAPADEAR